MVKLQWQLPSWLRSTKPRPSAPRTAKESPARLAASVKERLAERVAHLTSPESRLSRLEILLETHIEIINREREKAGLRSLEELEERANQIGSVADNCVRRSLKTIQWKPVEVIRPGSSAVVPANVIWSVLLVLFSVVVGLRLHKDLIKREDPDLSSHRKKEVRAYAHTQKRGAVFASSVALQAVTLSCCDRISRFQCSRFVQQGTTTAT